MQKVEMVNLIQGTQWASQMGYHIPAKRQEISDAIDVVGKAIWYSGGWDFRRRVTTMKTVSDKSLYTLNPDVDSIFDITYTDGDVMRAVEYRGEEYINVAFNGGDKDEGTTIRWWTYYKNDNGEIQIELLPTPKGQYDVTIRYYGHYVDFSDLPEKLVPVVMRGVRLLLTEGGFDGDAIYEQAIHKLRTESKVHKIRRWSFGKDWHARPFQNSGSSGG